MKKYYYASGVRVAMRTGTSNPLWLLGDHLGSTSKVVNYTGLTEQSQQLYKPWGEKRYPTGAPTLPTTFRYTGQRSETDLGPSGGEGLYFYNARWYDSQLGRFTQPDTVIPEQQGVQAWDRYAYVNNSPVNHIDPTGHYGEEVHRDLTYQIVHDTAMNVADEEGWGLQEINAFSDYLASEVARGDMAGDAKNIDNTVNINYIHNEPISPPGYRPIGHNSNGTIWAEYKQPHWYTTPEAAEDLNNTKNPFDFGIASHKYQDSFAHWQKLGQSDTPIGIWARHAWNNRYKLTDTSKSVDYFNPGCETKNQEIDAAMVTGYTRIVDSYIHEQISNWDYYGR